MGPVNLVSELSCRFYGYFIKHKGIRWVCVVGTYGGGFFGGETWSSHWVVKVDMSMLVEGLLESTG